MNGLEMTVDPAGTTTLTVRAPQALKPFIAEITGREPTYRYARTFIGRKLTEVGATELFGRVTVSYSRSNPATPQLLDIRGEERGYYCCYRDLRGTLRLDPIKGLLLDELLTARDAASQPAPLRQLAHYEQGVRVLEQRLQTLDDGLDRFLPPLDTLAALARRRELIAQLFTALDRLHDAQTMLPGAREFARLTLEHWRDLLLRDTDQLEAAARAAQSISAAPLRQPQRERLAQEAFATLAPPRKRRKPAAAPQAKLPPVLVTGRKRLISFD